MLRQRSFGLLYSAMMRSIQTSSMISFGTRSGGPIDLFAPAVELRLEVPHFCFDAGSQLFEDTGLASTLSRRL